MLIKKTSNPLEHRPNVRDGKGTLLFENIIRSNGMVPHARLMSVITIEPGDSLGRHEHVDETELYYMLSGVLTADDNGRKVKLEAGDTMITGRGAYHSVENTSREKATFLAIIITEAP